MKIIIYILALVIAFLFLLFILSNIQCENQSFLNFNWVQNILLFLIGILSTILWSLLLLNLRPNLEIKAEDNLNFRIENKGCTTAVNLKVEACMVDIKTTHFEINMTDFLMLPPENKCLNKDISFYRIFTITDLSQSYKKRNQNETFDNKINTLKSSKGNILLRIRVHANHEWSGFGKAFEQQFRYENNKFIPIKKCKK